MFTRVLDFFFNSSPKEQEPTLIDYMTGFHQAQSRQMSRIESMLGFVIAKLDQPDEKPAPASLVTEEANNGN